MVDNRLIWFLEHSQILNNHQMGLRKGAIDAVTKESVKNKINTIHKNLSNNFCATATILDISATYDSMDHNILILLVRGVPPSLTAMMYNLITDRKVNLNPQDILMNCRQPGKGLT